MADGRALVTGVAAGEVLALDEPLSMWGGLDPATGAIVDRRHPQLGAVVSGRVLVMPHGRGSSSAASVLAEALRAGVGPAAIVLREPDEILAVGSLVAAELYGIECPVVVLDEDGYAAAAASPRLEVVGPLGGSAASVGPGAPPPAAARTGAGEEALVLTVADIMTRELVTVSPNSTLREAAMEMLRHGVSGLPVVDAQGALVGIVSEADFVAQEAVHDIASRPRLLAPLFGRDDASLRSAENVGDVMTTEVVTVAPGDRVATAARRMAAGVKRLPVVDAHGELVGIVSRADILAVFARGDDAIAGDVRDLLAQGLLPITPEQVDVEVADGVVTLRGTVDARVDALILADIVGRFHGVIRVANRLDWDVDDRIPEQRFPGYPQEGKEE